MIRAGIIGEDEHLELIGGRIVAMSPEGALSEEARAITSSITHTKPFWSSKSPSRPLNTTAAKRRASTRAPVSRTTGSSI